MKLNVLIACEESQTECVEFRNLGHNAFSCDIQPSSGGHQEWHINQDCRPLLNGNCRFKTEDGKKHYIQGEWDLIIAHPPCTFLTKCGAVRLFSHKYGINEERLNKGKMAKEFFMMFFNARCKHIAIENPVPLKIFNLPKPTTYVEPFQFGEPFTKKTLLWLINLPPLFPTNYVHPVE